MSQPPGSEVKAGPHTTRRSERKEDRLQGAWLGAAIGGVIGTLSAVVASVASAWLLLALTPTVEERFRPASCDDPRGLDLVRPERVTSNIATHPQEGSQSYDLYQLLDGDAGTAWVEGVDEPDNPYGTGSRLRFHFPSSRDLQLVCVVNGYGRSWDTYQRNARVRLADVRTEQGDEEEAPLTERTEDTYGSHQQLEAPTGDTSWAELTIQRTRAGQGTERATDTAISEVEFWAKE